MSPQRRTCRSRRAATAAGGQLGAGPGFYAGLDGGYSFGRDPFMQNDPDQGGLLSQTPSVVTPQGGLFGGQLGYNWQFNNVVLGVEGDAQWATQNSTSCAITCASTSMSRTSSPARRSGKGWIGSPQRAPGLAGPMTVICSPAGWPGAAFARPTRSISKSPAAESFDRTLTGSAIGGGIEARVWGNWTAKVEYLHLNLGSMTNIAHLTFQSAGGVVAGPFTLTTTSSVRDDIIRVGVNYKFAGTAIDPAPAAAALALPVKAAAAVWSWTGFYLGIDGGYGVGSDPFSQMQLVAGTLVDSTFM